MFKYTEGMRSVERLESRISALESKLNQGCGRRDESGGREEMSGASVEGKVDQDGVDRWEQEERLKRKTCYCAWFGGVGFS